MPSDKPVISLDQIDDAWRAVDIATLVFVVTGGKILLIRKKRGLGAGKINGPGGKLEKGETPLQCAVREVKEELGIVIRNPVARGELRFQFIDGYSIHVHVFLSDDFSGEPGETDEATPLWFDLADIPYNEMWADDVLWLPRLLEGANVRGRFMFSGDTILEHEVMFSNSSSP